MGARAAAGRGLVRADAVGVFFGTVSGKTEEVAGLIAEALGTEAQDISEVDGAPTWNTGADEQRTSTAWDDLFEEIDGLDLGGKPVAIFGLGDSSSYGDNFCDAIEEMHGHFASAGAKMVGYVSTDGYTFDDPKSVVDGQFLGLPLDEDSEDDLTEGRYTAWVEQIKGEGVN